jgi:hypothetical protein
MTWFKRKKRMQILNDIVPITALIALSILANMMGWSGGAEKILTASLVAFYFISLKKT